MENGKNQGSGYGGGRTERIRVRVMEEGERKGSGLGLWRRERGKDWES